MTAVLPVTRVKFTQMNSFEGTGHMRFVMWQTVFMAISRHKKSMKKPGWIFYRVITFAAAAHVVKLVDTLSSGGSAFGRGGSSPLVRTDPEKLWFLRIFYLRTPELAQKCTNKKDCKAISGVVQDLSNPLWSVTPQAWQSSRADLAQKFAQTKKLQGHESRINQNYHAISTSDETPEKWQLSYGNLS